MEFFDKLGETIVSAGKDVTQKAREMSDTAKLKLDIKAKQDFIEKQYMEIGRAYFEAHRNDMKESEREQFAVVEEALDEIKKMELQLLEIKGAKKCPKCGAEVSEGAEFCSSCGTKLGIFEED